MGLVAVLACVTAPEAVRADPQICRARMEALKDAMSADPARQTETALFDAVAADCGDTSARLSAAWHSLAIDLIYRELLTAADLALDRRDAQRRDVGGEPDYELRARVAVARQDWPSAEVLLGRAYQFYADRPEVRSAHGAELLQERAHARLQMGDAAGARAMAEQALAVGEAASGLRHASLWETVALIGDTWAAEGDMDRALARYQDALSYFRPEHQSNTSAVRNRLAGAWLGAGRLAEAEVEARLAIRYGVYAMNSEADRRRYRQTLAAILAAQGRGEEAMAELAAASGSAEAAFALNGDAQDLLGVARVLWQGRQYRYAAFYYDLAYQSLDDRLPPGAPARATTAINAAQAHLFAGSVHFAVDGYRRAAEEVAVLGRPPRQQRSFRRGQVLALWAAAHWTADD